MNHENNMVSCYQVFFSVLFLVLFAPSVNRLERDSAGEENERKISEATIGKKCKYYFIKFLLPASQCLLGHSAKEIYMISYTKKFENQCPGGKLKFDYQRR